jgi:hypothetical protein
MGSLLLLLLEKHGRASVSQAADALKVCVRRAAS